MTNELKSFHISDVVSATTGRLVSLNGMQGIYDILSYMAGTDLFTHQLPTVSRQAEPLLKKAYPFLGEIVFPEINTEDDVKAFIDELVEKHGEYLIIFPLDSPFIPTLSEAIALAKTELNTDG